MEKLYVIFVIALVLAHAEARNIPNDHTKPSTTTNALATAENTESVVTTADAVPVAEGVDDQKNFITYGGMGGWAGIGYIGGVIPVIPVLGVGGATGLGGLGGAGGAGGLGGIGGAGAAGGAAGKTVP